MARRIFITAAEVSGDLHASHLVRALRESDPELVIEGHGGPRMRQAGCRIHHETTAQAAMGMGALGRVREMLGLVKRTRAMFKEGLPDLQICVDSPALNFHFAKLAKETGVPVLYYVAPQLWAWREGRMKKLRRWVDKVACILPFEEAYFRSHGVDATFVGHPLFDELEEGAGGLRTDGGLPNADCRLPIEDQTAGQRPAHAMEGSGGGLTVGLLAGSRRSEAVGNFGRMLEVAGRVVEAFPTIQFLAPVTEATEPVVRGMLETTDARVARAITVERDAFDRFVPRCDLVLTVSGTATLHVAIHNTPMVVVYHGSALLWNLIGRWLIKTRTYGLVNLLAADPALASSGRVTPAMHVVPEFIPWYGSTAPVSERVIELLRDPGKRAAQRQSLATLVSKLNRRGASARTAEMALGLIR